MASSPPRAPRRFLFDLNVAQEEFEEEPEEAFQEVVVEEVPAEQHGDAAAEEEVVKEVIEREVGDLREEPPDEVIMEEEEEEAAALLPLPADEMMGEDEAGEEEEPGARKKRMDYEVFVGGLPHDAAEEDVARALADAGEVEEVRLVRDPADHRLNKGFAFVRFAAAWQARWAADDLREATVLHPIPPLQYIDSHPLLAW